jgi:peptidyl-tRNA hydrolase
MYIVLPRRPQRSREELLGDAVRAVLAARDLFESTDAWRAWAARPRKVCVRGRPAEVERVRELPHARAGEALCLPPRLRSEREPELLKLQAHSGGPLEAGDPSPPHPGRALFLLRCDLGMTFGKAVAQIGHAALALGEAADLDVRLADKATFARVDAELDPACVRDAGLTEVAPGTVTALALPPRELPQWLSRALLAVGQGG